MIYGNADSFPARLLLFTALAVGIAESGLRHAWAEEPATVPLNKPADSPRGDSLNKNRATDAKAVRSPELIAIAWQRIPNNPIEDLTQVDQPAWRPDGTLLTKEESNELRELAGGFQAHWWNKDDELRPLVLLFRTDPKISVGIMPRIVLPEGQYSYGGSSGLNRADGLTKSASSPFRRSLPVWPEKVDLEIKVPLENWTVIKTVNEIPDEPIEVAPGVRWYIDPQRGIDYSNPKRPVSGLKAGVLEVRTDPIISLAKYDVKVWIKDKQEPLAGGYSTIIGTKPDERLHIEVTRPIDDVSVIQKVEILRQRFRFDRINGVPTHLDLMPSDD